MTLEDTISEPVDQTDSIQPVRFSGLDNYFDTEPKDYTSDQISSILRDGVYQQQVAKFRASKDSERVMYGKNNILIVYPNGTISNTKTLVRFSGLIYLALKVDQLRSQELKEKLTRDPCTYMVFVNLLGDGLVVWLQAETIPDDKAQFIAYGKAAVGYLERKYELTSDELSAVNLSPTTACWIGLDVDVWTNFYPKRINLHSVVDQLDDQFEKQSFSSSKGYTGSTATSHIQADLRGEQQHAQDAANSQDQAKHKRTDTNGFTNDPKYIGLLTVRTANGWIEDAMAKSPPKKLFDGFWGEGEICILYAESNQGKTILAVQIGDGISRGRAIKGFQMEADPQIVLYCDFELSSKQFEARYSEEFTNHYQWHSNFRRIEINTEADVPNGISFEDYLNESLEKAIEETRAKVLIIDNLTYLRTDTESAKDAGPLMKYLKLLKQKYGLSLLILAHTPKRDASRPLTRNDLQGSSRLNQFADSMFAIGSSARDSQLKYIKQVKVRSAAYRYDSDNVVVCQIVKQNSFLMFEQMRYSTEQEHLKLPTEKDTANLPEEIQALQKAGKTQQQIALTLGISQPKVSRILAKLAADK